ncbi:Crp/Fnr family transcriptional regulator [Sulfurovum sp. zt1-1]|uniref:Crp/Fnr family transcriptional regulator n=1 Tax=Sulfurovum zhangzhouensis TaxID=3019067 RepID=A0ABT7QXE2_9BACT|nr:Crp/Fnr family transcriptional regulator [Sulfurovum zhangzhouensis]MDM5271504.1 Crp/Fnr family transcriptional regulator [Sulfurovum zhangzhouensis]
MEIKDIDLFSTFDQSSLDFLSTITKKRTYQKGNILFYAGEKPRSLLILMQGSVEVYKHDTEGNEIVLGTFYPQELIAEMALFESIPYPATARCLSNVTLFEIEFDTFNKYLYKHSHLILPIIHSLTRKIKHLEGVLRYTLIDDASKRLARFLIDHEHQLLHLTQRNIAQRIKLTPESTSRIIRTFKEKRWVEIRQKKLYLLDVEALKTFSE